MANDEAYRPFPRWQLWFTSVTWNTLSAIVHNGMSGQNTLPPCFPHRPGSSSCPLTNTPQLQSLLLLFDRVAHPSLLWIVMVTRERLAPHAEDSFSGTLLPPTSVLSRRVPLILGVECISPEFERLSDRHCQNDRLSDGSAAIPAIRSKGPSSDGFKSSRSHYSALRSSYIGSYLS